MKFTGTQMRNELKFVTEAFSLVERFLDERFLNGDDPTVVIGKALEGLALHTANLQSLYKAEAQDRNKIKSTAMTELKAIADLCNQAVAAMGNQFGPEDTNRSI